MEKTSKQTPGMFLKVIGSSSRGNGYILENGTEALVIEAGVPFLSVKKELDYDISKIVGVIISHSHKDHSKYINEYLDAGIDVWIGELKGFDITSKKCPYLSEHLHKFKLGNFSIKSIEVKHDVPCLSFLIKHPEMGLCYFSTDTYYLPFRVKGLNHLIIEANYSEQILEDNIKSGKTELIVRNRVIRSHMSLEILKQALLENDLSQVNNIVLIHLSRDNANPNQFKKEIEGVTGKRVNIASKGLKIPFNKQPF